MAVEESLCESCRHLREVVSGRGSRFLMCLFAGTDARFPKYPRQPIRKCGGYQERTSNVDEGESATMLADEV